MPNRPGTDDRFWEMIMSEDTFSRSLKKIQGYNNQTQNISILYNLFNSTLICSSKLISNRITGKTITVGQRYEIP